MTREEAIQHGKEQLDVFGGTHREFIEMAIKALSVVDDTEKQLENERNNWVQWRDACRTEEAKRYYDGGLDALMRAIIELQQSRYLKELQVLPNCGAEMENGE